MYQDPLDANLLFLIFPSFWPFQCDLDQFTQIYKRSFSLHSPIPAVEFRRQINQNQCGGCFECSGMKQIQNIR